MSVSGGLFVQNVKGLTTQFSWFKNWKNEVVSLVGQEKGNYIVGKALYVISTGSNDWVNNYYINLELMNKYSTDTYTTFLIDLVGSYVKVHHAYHTVLTLI